MAVKSVGNYNLVAVCLVYIILRTMTCTCDVCIPTKNIAKDIYVAIANINFLLTLTSSTRAWVLPLVLDL